MKKTSPQFVKVLLDWRQLEANLSAYPRPVGSAPSPLKEVADPLQILLVINLPKKIGRVQ